MKILLKGLNIFHKRPKNIKRKMFATILNYAYLLNYRTQEIFIKSIILLLMLATPGLASSQSIPMMQIIDIVHAIKESLLNKDLDCHESVKNLSFKASLLEWDALNNLEISINIDQQPVIEFHRVAIQESIAKHLDTTITITTNSDFTIVEEINGAQYEIVDILSKNIGTIINPIFKKTSIKGKLHQQIVCK